MCGRANGYRQAGRNEEALPVAIEMWEVVQKVLPPDDPQFLRAKCTLGSCYCDEGQRLRPSPC